MKNHFKIRALRLFSVAVAATLSVALCSVTAQAQGADPAARDSATEDVAISGSNMSAREKQDFAQAAVQDLETTTNRILRLIEEAQKKKDVVLLNCLNDKLGALRGLLKVAGDSKLNLAEAAARENLDLQEHNFRKLFIAKQQALTVTSEADACVGQVGIVTAGQTRVVVSVEGGDPGADSGYGASTGGSSRPPDTSPFQ
jgi:prephenate dehydratase